MATPQPIPESDVFSSSWITDRHTAGNMILQTRESGSTKPLTAIQILFRH